MNSIKRNLKAQLIPFSLMINLDLVLALDLINISNLDSSFLDNSFILGYKIST